MYILRVWYEFPKVSLGATEIKRQIKYPESNSSVLVFLSKSTGKTKYLFKKSKTSKTMLKTTGIDDSF